MMRLCSMLSMGDKIQNISVHELHTLLAQDTLVVTANQRLSRRITHEYAAYRRAQGDSCWPTAQVLPWSAWLLKLWDEALFTAADDVSARVVLSPQQTRLLWEQVIRRSPLDKGVLNIQSTAAGVAKAWTLLQAWDMPLPELADYPNEDAAAFRLWAQSFQQMCDQQGWVDSARLPDQLIAVLDNPDAQDSRIIPKRIVLIGFDEVTPQQTRWLKTLEAHDCVCDSRQFSPLDSSPARIRCHDTEDEFARAANWVREKLQHDPHSSIAVVVPDLQSQRDRIERIFADVLHPEQLLPGNGPDINGPGENGSHRQNQRCFNISLGRGLAQQPMIRAALNILRLAQGRIDAHALGSLLRSPYLSESEASGRAQLDVLLRERGDYEVWLVDLLAMIRSTARADEQDRQTVLTPLLLQRLEQLFDQHQAIKGKLFHHDWAQRFTSWLQIMGWPNQPSQPGQRGLNSDEHQQLQAWQTLLDDFSSLGLITQTVSARTALTQLNQLASVQLFQARAPWRPVQILGLLEAGGQRFDYLWVCGMDDESWPAPARPNPWLPLQQQRKYGLPHAEAERELQYARSVTQQLSQAAPHVIFSTAYWEGDRQRQPSPLISHFPGLEADQLPPANTHLLRDTLYKTGELEAQTDNQAPALPAGNTPGGSGVIAAQAACPFQAYGRHRLGASALEEVSLAPDARQRGLLLHQAMQALWARMEGSEALHAKSEAELRTLIESAVAPLVEAASRLKPRTYTPRFIAVEKRVLGTLILEWLQVELARESFTVVAREHHATVALAGLEFKVYLDRVDHTHSGQPIILDYKTGQVSPSGWQDERPDAPQLPLYTLALDSAPAAVAFAQIRPGQMRFVGSGRKGASLPGVKAQSADEWQEQLLTWKEALTAIAAEFRTGVAQVAPKSPARTCRYCDLTPLCRIHEAQNANASPDEGLVND